MACRSYHYHQHRRHRRRLRLAVMPTGNLLPEDHRDLLEERETGLAKADSPRKRALDIVGLATDGAVVRRQNRLVPTHRTEEVDGHWLVPLGKHLPSHSSHERDTTTTPRHDGLMRLAVGTYLERVPGCSIAAVPVVRLAPSKVERRIRMDILLRESARVGQGRTRAGSVATWMPRGDFHSLSLL